MKLIDIITQRISEARINEHDPIWKDTTLLKNDIKLDPTRAGDHDLYTAMLELAMVECARKMIEAQAKFDRDFNADEDEPPHDVFDNSQRELADNVYEEMQRMCDSINNMLDQASIDEVVAVQFKSLPKTRKDIKKAQS
jgi:signal transduction histidine kinase